MFIKNLLRNIISKSDYVVYKKQFLPPGMNLFYDIKYKFPNSNINTIFDVGANIGQMSMQFQKDFPDSKIYSFEPVKSTFNKLSNRFAKNTNVFTINLALGLNEGTQHISLYPDNLSVLNSLKHENTNVNDILIKEVINIDTLDNFFEKNQIGNIDILKIDVEGSEMDVLKGAEQTIKNKLVNFILIEVGMCDFNKRHIKISEMIDYLNQKGFLFFCLYDISNTAFENGIPRMTFANALFYNENIVLKK